MKKFITIFFLALVSWSIFESNIQAADSKSKLTDLVQTNKNQLYTNSRQITFKGPKSGEGYFSADGQKMIFQSEREPQNPFYQMYILDLKTGESKRISPGQGKTTCGWIHPNLKKAMWSSTHLDKTIKEKVKAEYEERAKPVKGRYSWSFDDQYEIFESDLNGQKIKRLTNAKGYDAEGSYSPDGQWIAFASNRSGYDPKETSQWSDEEKKIFEKDPSYAMEIYIMKADGTQVKRLTKSSGYDGGPFFSADGKKITWRRFTPDGSKAEIFTMNVDGSEQKAITKLGSMSWAPYFHPSGKYIIFGSSVHGYSNFELFIVDSEGLRKPVQVTFTEGFDGLASFSPDGKTLTWSHRNEKGESQIYLADWDHQLALNLLEINESQRNLAQLEPSIEELDAKAIVQYLASAEMKGRMSGSEEEKIYTAKIAELFKQWGLKPAYGSDYILPFEFTSGVEASDKNSLQYKGRFERKLIKGVDYQVLSYSKTGSFPAAPIVFAGFGLVTPATEKISAFDSYKDLEVQGKWVVVLDGIPENVEKEKKLHFLSYSRPQHKITVAKNRGAAGVVFLTDIGIKTLKFEGSLSETTLPVLKLTPKAFNHVLAAGQFDSYKKLYEAFQSSPEQKGFIIPSQYLEAEVDLKFKKTTGLNVVAKIDPLQKSNLKSKALILGAHGDHLGLGDSTGSSLARPDEKSKIHFGADDNASGVAGVLELAAYFSKSENLQKLKRPLYFAIWSGEEIGVLGSSHFSKSWKEITKKEMNQDFEASINMDMIGRFREQLQMQGVASASEWTGLAEEVTLVTGVPYALTTDPYLPTDAMTFYLAQLPSISFFTGSHEEYHSPRDTADLINYRGLVKVIDSIRVLTEKLAFSSGSLLTYQKVEGNSGQKLEGRQFRIFLGTIPDYSQEGVKGVRVSGAAKNSPAEKAGVAKGDVIVEFDNTKIENLYDYVYALQAAKPNQATKISVLRQGKIIELDIVPLLKE